MPISHCELFDTLTFPVEEQWYYLTYSWGTKEIHTFLKCIILYVNVIARLEFKLAYYDVTLQY